MILNQRKVTSQVLGVVLERYSSPGEFANDEALMQRAQINLLNEEVMLPASCLTPFNPVCRERSSLNHQLTVKPIRRM
jgi:hypothetical protein